MKKLLVLLAVLTLSFTLTACNGEEDLPETMTMAELDGFMGRSDVQYIDLRNFDERMKAGYIEGFEVIPYFDYLKYQGILSDANGGWVFDTGEIGAVGSMREMFNEDKTILLMCGSGTRAQYVMDALLSLGYENVINIGGYAAYIEADGEAVVLGGESFYINMDAKGTYTPGTYFGVSDGLYLATVVINDAGGIQSVFFDAVTCDTDTDADDVKDSDCTTKQAKGDDYGMVTYGSAVQEWYLQANEVAVAVVANQGWDTDGIDDLAGVTITVTGFEDALEDALTQATD
ncbi:MAG: hypothetical protein KQ78_00298 [Candidatus Izimaplasma bacterium HR2]|nr:MAG: hypothetical protein KQ78_00298 [Candidatus Izimaplasma bacterium HR2]